MRELIVIRKIDFDLILGNLGKEVHYIPPPHSKTPPSHPSPLPPLLFKIKPKSNGPHILSFFLLLLGCWIVLRSLAAKIGGTMIPWDPPKHKNTKISKSE
jgi:hypothetical protein